MKETVLARYLSAFSYDGGEVSRRLEQSNKYVLVNDIGSIASEGANDWLLSSYGLNCAHDRCLRQAIGPFTTPLDVCSFDYLKY